MSLSPNRSTRNKKTTSSKSKSKSQISISNSKSIKKTSTQSKKNRRGGKFHVMKFSEKEKKILYKYTTTEDFFINKMLRMDNYKDLYDAMNKQEVFDKDEKIKRTIDSIKIIDNIMREKAPIVKEDLILYRGTKNKKDDEPYTGINKGYISTSKSLAALEKNSFRFLDEKNTCCLYIYTIKKNVPYINLSQISYFSENHQQSQEEILLPRGLVTRIDPHEISETILNDVPYKTYNVTIELNNQSTYDIEDIEKSSNILEMLKVFNVLYLIGDMHGFFYTKSQEYNGRYLDDDIDIDDIDIVFDNFIDMLLLRTFSPSDILKKVSVYIESLITKIGKIKFLKEDDKNELIAYKYQIQEMEKKE